MRGGRGEEKNHIKRRVERQKVFSSPPAINQSSFITQPNSFKKSVFVQYTGYENLLFGEIGEFKFFYGYI